MTLNGFEFELVQLHFHTQSEHFIHDAYYPLETHFVFLSKTAGLAHRDSSPASQSLSAAVMTFHFETAPSDSEPVFRTIFGNVSGIPYPSNVTETGPLNFSDPICAFLSSNIYRYTGSLTTPPCTEGVQFLISDLRLNISNERFEKVQGFNARNVQGVLGEENLIVQAARIFV